MEPQKTWTMMVYLAADNNLFTFGVDSLRQMKAAARNNVNILAEFDTGPMNRAKRYFFDGRKPIGSIEDNVVETFGPTDAADPENLVNFIAWGKKNYPADHYFVVIWGHGGGVDDDFPRRNDNSFVPRHALLSLFKGTSNDFPKGTSNDFPKGTSNDFPKGTAANQPLSALDAYLEELLRAPLKDIVDIFNFGEGALHRAAIETLKQGVSHALGQDVLNKIQQSGITGNNTSGLTEQQIKDLEELKKGILKALDGVDPEMLNENLKFLRRGILAAFQRGIFNALRTEALLKLQKDVLKAVHEGNVAAAIDRIRSASVNAVIHFLENGMLEIQHSGILDILQNHIIPPRKSLAFVDHPEDFLTNTGLEKALRMASQLIGQKIDILGMDSCNMNMIEIGYELRDSVNFLIASQDGIPDASWPYDRIIHKLVSQPDLLPETLAAEVVTTFINGYRDYSQQDVKTGELAELDEPVTLSVLELNRMQTAVPLLSNLARVLTNALSNLDGREAIFRARRLVKSFSENQFIDLIQFCRALTKGAGDPKQARSANPTSPIVIDPEIKQLTEIANSVIGPLVSMVRERDFSKGDEDCTGTSAYLPEYDPDEEPHQQRLGKLYNELDFAKVTGWGSFVTEFLNQQKKQFEGAKILAQATTKAKNKASADMVSRLETAKESSEVASKDLTEIVRMSVSAASPVNGTLDGAAQVARAIALKVRAVVDEIKNGGPHAGTYQNNRAHDKK